MCGITGIHFKNPRDMGVSRDQLETLVDELLLGIEPRGKDATGLLVVDKNNKPFLEKADVRASVFVKYRTDLPKRIRTILGHTRLATQGEPKILENNHPVQYDTCYAIHNGHISNDADLFVENELTRYAEVDSEIIPALFNKYGLDKAHLALQELEGGYATAVVDPERFPGKLVLAKGWSSPVEYIETKYALVWASTTSALQEACQKALGFRPKLDRIQSLDPGELLYVDGDKIEKLTFKPKAKRSRAVYSTSNGWAGGWNGSYANTRYSNDEIYTDCASCGHARVHHGSGTDYSGACHLVENRSGANEFACRCINFVQPQESNPLGTDWCDECGREFTMDALTKGGSSYFCKWCLRPPEGPNSQELRRRAESVMERMQSVAEEFNVETWANVVDAAREQEIHAHACQMVSGKLSFSASFVDWLLKAGKDVEDSDTTGYIKKCRAEAMEAYEDAEKLLRWELVDIEVQEYTEQAMATEVVVDSDGIKVEPVEPDGEEIVVGQTWVAQGGELISMEEWKEQQRAIEEAEEGELVG